MIFQFILYLRKTVVKKEQRKLRTNVYSGKITTYLHQINPISEICYQRKQKVRLRFWFWLATIDIGQENILFWIKLYFHSVGSSNSLTRGILCQTVSNISHSTVIMDTKNEFSLHSISLLNIHDNLFGS